MGRSRAARPTGRAGLVECPFPHISWCQQSTFPAASTSAATARQPPRRTAPRFSSSAGSRPPGPAGPARPWRARRRQGDVVGSVVAVAAGTLRVRDRHDVFGEAKRAGEFGPQHINALGMRPDHEPAVFPAAEQGGGHSMAPWTRVPDTAGGRWPRPTWRSARRSGACHVRRARIVSAGAERRRPAGRRSPVESGAAPRWRRRAAGRRAQRHLFALGDHTEEAAVPHHRVSTARQRERHRRIETRQRRASGRRSDDPAVTQASGDRSCAANEVGPVSLSGRSSLGHARADDAIRGRGLGLPLATGRPGRAARRLRVPSSWWTGPSGCQDLAESATV